VIVRAARAQDGGAIAPFLNQVIDDTTITFTTARKSDVLIAAEITERQGAYFVAEKDGQVVGFATYFPFRGGPGYARTKEHTVVLAPAARGLGSVRKIRWVWPFMQPSGFGRSRCCPRLATSSGAGSILC
jgi:phosphinothricin acetyltransferase